jgi:energy-coupling factor transporter transmembrane protein EcfT
MYIVLIFSFITLFLNERFLELIFFLFFLFLLFFSSKIFFLHFNFFFYFYSFWLAHESINVGVLKNSGANPGNNNSPNPIIKNSSGNNHNNLANSAGGQPGKTISLNQSQPSRPNTKPRSNSKSSKSQELDGSDDDEIPSSGADVGLTTGPRVIGIISFLIMF